VTLISDNAAKKNRLEHACEQIEVLDEVRELLQ
jgi:hypothetical protein